MNGNRVLTLYYHKVNVLEHDHNLLCVSPIRFRQQMLHLKRNYHIVRFGEDWNALDSDAVAVTFDDGYFDNLEYALPILEELEVPATVFVSTGTLGQDKELWWDELERLVLRGHGIPQSFRLADDEFGCEWDTSTWEHRKNAYGALHYLMKNVADPDKRERWLMQLWDWRRLSRMPRKESLTLSPDGCRKLSASGMISIGAHTVSHPSLARLDGKLQEHEIRRSIDALSEITGEKVTLFSYPFGQPGEDFDDKAVEICRRCGIAKAASTENALWSSETDPHRIPRKVARDWDLWEFGRRIKEYWEG